MKTMHFVSADEAVSHIPSHCHIHLSSVASVPHCLISALCRRADAGDVKDLHFHHFHTEGPAPYSEPRYEGIFFEQGFFVGPNVRKNVNAGYADYLPVHLGESQKLYRDGAIKLGAALVNVSLPNAEGKVSLGTSVDCSVAAVECADLVIGVINPNVPFAYGDLLDLDQFDYLVQDDTPLVTAGFAEPTPTEVLIGKNCASLGEDGDCINGSHKKIDTGKVVASFLLGSNEVYSFINDNPTVLMKDIKYTNDPWVISQNPNMKAINSATEVDLTGQISADSIGTRIFSGTGGQLEFVRGATMSKGGKSITAFASRTNKGKNKIVAELNSGAGVVTPRADAHWIVTEYGAVDLYGKSLQERAKLMISIAHPDDREMLDRQAFERFGPHWHNLSV